MHFDIENFKKAVRNCDKVLVAVHHPETDEEVLVEVDYLEIRDAGTVLLHITSPV